MCSIPKLYDNLPIYKSALDFCVYIETIVQNFNKYHKYNIGADLRTMSQELLITIHRANTLVSKRKSEFLPPYKTHFKIAQNIYHIMKRWYEIWVLHR